MCVRLRDTITPKFTQLVLLLPHDIPRVQEVYGWMVHVHVHAGYRYNVRVHFTITFYNTVVPGTYTGPWSDGTLA